MQRKQLPKGDRDDRMIWRTVQRVAKRAGVLTKVHAFPAAFAVHYPETHIGGLEALQALMGHKRIETTQVYLRRLNREKAMDRVRDLSWGCHGLIPLQ
jgi:site-specific recombinase XerD